MFYYLNEKHMQKFRHFWSENDYPKKSLETVLHQAIQLLSNSTMIVVTIAW